jgi:predicted dehydrogenase
MLISRALVVGLGSIGRRHLELLRAALPEADIRVLRHSGCSQVIQYSDGCFDSLADACRFAPEIAVIASPATKHLDSAVALAKAGAHLLIEKPISNSAEGVGALLEICAQKQRHIQIGYNLRFLESLQAFKSGIEDNLLGPIYSVRAEIGQFLPEWRPEKDYRETVSARRDLGGGVLLELSHEFDFLRWIFGEVEWVSAWIGRQGSFEIDVEDTAMIQFGFQKDIVGHLSMDFLRRDRTRTCSVIGALGTLRWDAIAGTVEVFDTKTDSWGKKYSDTSDRNASYEAQLDAFLSIVEKGAEIKLAASSSDGLAVMRIIDAVRRSDKNQGIRTPVLD